jgi:Cu/Ag efflux protein CusF
MRFMGRISGFIVMGLLAATVALAQVKELPGARVTRTGTVEAVDHTARMLTLKDEKGVVDTVDVPKTVERFDAMKVGDNVTVTYYDNVVVRLKSPGEAPVNKLESGLTRTTGDKPGGTVAAQRTMTAKIEAIDVSIPSITFLGPNGWKYSRRVEDKNVLKQVKVGDQVDFTWTEAIQITVNPPKK